MTEWLENGKHIVIIYYEELIQKDNLIPTLEKIVGFMNFKVPKERLSCVVKHQNGKFIQNGKCITKTQKRACEEDDFIYSKKHVRWINSAIRKVNKAIRNRGFDHSQLQAYENTNLKLPYCSEN